MSLTKWILNDSKKRAIGRSWRDTVKYLQQHSSVSQLELIPFSLYIVFIFLICKELIWLCHLMLGCWGWCFWTYRGSQRMLPAQGPGCVWEYQITTNDVQIYTCRESPRYGAGSETPMHPSRTPMHHPSYMTPMRDSSFGTGSHCLPIVFRNKRNCLQVW